MIFHAQQASNHTFSSANDNKEKKFLCKYEYQNNDYCITIIASSIEEASAKLKQVSAGQVVGELKAVVPGEFGWIAKATVKIQNFLKSLPI